MKLLNWKTREKLAPYIFISPYILLFTVFTLVPMASSIIMSLMKWNGVSEMEWVGLSNYIKLFGDKIFIQSLINSVVIFAMYVPVMLFLALVLAVILNQGMVKGKGFFRVAFYIPNITSTVAVAFIFMMLFDTKYGIINLIITKLGGSAYSWLGTVLGGRVVIAVVVIWRWLGYNMILLLAGLQSISKELYEAATIDGASKVTVFTKITLPLMKPLLLFCTVLSTVGTFSLFTEPLLMTNGGGPMYKTISPVLYIYSESFSRLRMGYASSAGFTFFILMFGLTILQFVLTRERK